MAKYLVTAYGSGWFTVIVEADSEEKAEEEFYNRNFNRFEDWEIEEDGIGNIKKLKNTEVDANEKS